MNNHHEGVTMDFDRIKAAQGGLVDALLGNDPEGDDGYPIVADVENAAPNEIILKGSFNTNTPAIIALHRADKVDEERGIARVRISQDVVDAVAEAMWMHRPMKRNPDGSPAPWSEAHQPFADRYRGFAEAACTVIKASAVRP